MIDALILPLLDMVNNLDLLRLSLMHQMLRSLSLLENVNNTTIVVGLQSTMCLFVLSRKVTESKMTRMMQHHDQYREITREKNELQVSIRMRTTKNKQCVTTQTERENVSS